MKRRHIGRLALALFWVMAYGSSAHADSRSRAEVQGGAAFLNTTPALAIGGTGWINRRAGVSVRVYFMRSGDLEDPRHIETMFRLRRFAGEVEIDVGMGLGSSRHSEVTWSVVDGTTTVIRTELERERYVTMDVLLGQRRGRRVGVKLGVGLVVATDGLGFIGKFSAVLPLGSL